MDPRHRAAASVEAERAKPMTPAEATAHAESFEKLAEMLVAPGRKATAAEIANVEVLRFAAREMVTSISFVARG